MMQNGIDAVILEDTKVYINNLWMSYGIRMVNTRVQTGLRFQGEYYTQRGTILYLHITVIQGRTEIKIFTMDRQCIYQKVYNTATNKHALTKSVGTTKFIEQSFQRY